MSTRSLTRFLDEDGGVLASLYVHHDGYPSGRGEELMRRLAGVTLEEHGPWYGERYRHVAEVAGKQIAQDVLVRNDVRLVPTTCTASDCGAEYVYEIRVGQKDPPWRGPSLAWKVVEVRDAGDVILYDGPISKTVWPAE